MQQDAVRRVQEMQSRARQAVDHSRPAPPSQENKGDSSASARQESNPSGETTVPSKVSPSLLETLMQDSERTLILVLLLLLASEKADMELMLALMYLLL